MTKFDNEFKMHEALSTALSTEFPTCDVLTNPRLSGIESSNISPDVYIDSHRLAIECKNTHNVRKVSHGVGQALHYEVSGYTPVLCVPSSAPITEALNMCFRAGIGLITISDKNNNSFPEYDCVLDTPSGFFIGDRHAYESLTLFRSLEYLDITSAGDIVELNDMLLDLRANNQSDFSQNGKFMRDVDWMRQCLPET